MPAFIHSDRGTSFMSRELREFLTSKGVSTSRTTPYNPAGNGEIERYNGVIWKGISSSLKGRRAFPWFTQLAGGSSGCSTLSAFTALHRNALHPWRTIVWPDAALHHRKFTSFVGDHTWTGFTEETCPKFENGSFSWGGGFGRS